MENNQNCFPEGLAAHATVTARSESNLQHILWKVEVQKIKKEAFHVDVFLIPSHLGHIGGVRTLPLISHCSHDRSIVAHLCYQRSTCCMSSGSCSKKYTEALCPNLQACSIHSVGRETNQAPSDQWGPYTGESLLK